MRESNRNLIFLTIAAISGMLFIIGYSDTSLSLMMLSILVLFGGTLAYSLSFGNKMIIFTAFLVCFFTFVLGDWGINFLAGENWGNNFDRATIRHVLVCVYLSLFSILIGAMLGNIKSEKTQRQVDFKEYQKQNAKFEGTIRVLFYCTIIFSFMTVVKRAIFVFQHSYIDTYNTTEYAMPYMVQKLALASDFLFYTYLAILPEKKKAKKPIFIYFIVKLLSILGGVRGTSVKATIMVLAYSFFRNTTDEEKWVKKKHIIMLCIAVPVAIVLLSLYNYWRGGMSASYYGFWNEFINFFTTQGGSINVIGYEKKFHNALPETNISYTFGSIINWYRYGFLGKIINFFTGQEFINLSSSKIKMALYGNNLGSIITYLVMPYNYLAGVGLGTQYIAELFSDFGYVGVMLFNIFLGWFITKCRFVYFKKWYWNAISISVTYILFGIGRDFALSFVPYYVSVANWTMIAIIHGLSKVKLRKRGDLKNENTLDL